MFKGKIVLGVCLDCSVASEWSSVYTTPNFSPPSALLTHRHPPQAAQSTLAEDATTAQPLWSDLGQKCCVTVGLKMSKILNKEPLVYKAEKENSVRELRKFHERKG